MSKTTKWILFSLIGIVALLFIIKAVKGKDDDGIKVTAEPVKQRTLIETVSASGKVYPETEIKVGSPIAGELITLNVKEGDTVTKGQVLARIQGDKNTVAAPRISLPTIPPGLEGLVQGMQQPARSTTSSAVITAPISGTVIGLTGKQGERVGTMQMAGSELMRIANMNSIEVRVDVNENNIIKVSIGDSADVEVEAYNKRKFKGVVTGISNGGSSRRDAQSFMSADVTAYEVRIKLDKSSYADLFDTTRRNLPFRSGMNARAEIKTRRAENVLSVPVGAVVSKPKGADVIAENKTANEKATTDSIDNMGDELEEVVFVIKGDKTVEKRTVKTGVQDIRYFQILDGVKTGEEVVTAPYGVVSKTLQTGKKVQVVSREKLFENK